MVETTAVKAIVTYSGGVVVVVVVLSNTGHERYTNKRFYSGDFFTLKTRHI